MRHPIDLVGGFYTDESLPWSCQDTVNWIPVAAEVGGTRTPTKLVDAPGLRPWVWIGNHADGVDSAPIRGLHDVEGQLFAVCGQTLYRIRPDGIAVPLGTIPGVGRVSMSHNQQSVGNQLLVVNGTGGYVWNTGTEEFTVVTDDGYPGAFAVDFLDGYLMQVEPFGRFLFHSDLADALDYNTLDRFEAETAPDRVVGMIVNHREVWAFGERTIDIFDNVGTATGTFQNKGISLSRGCIAKWSPAVIDNGIAWLGDDRVVYHARGYDAIRISTRAIEVALAEIPLTDIRNAFSFVWSDRGHAVYYLTVPNGQTFGYDFSTGLWHRRASWHPERDISGRWRLNDLVRSNGRWIGGDYQTGKLYELDWDYMLEGDQELVRGRVSPVAHDDGRRFTTDAVELFFDTGGETTSAGEFKTQPKGPKISGDAPDGVVGFPYDGYQYTVTAGDSPVTSVQIVSGELPGGLSLDNSGEIDTGIPTKGGDFSFLVRVTDSIGLWDQVPDSITIADAAVLLFATDVGDQREGVYATGDIFDFGPRTDFVPILNTGEHVLRGGVAVSGGYWVAATSQNRMIRAPLPPYGSTVEWEHVGSALNGDYVKSIDGVLFAYPRLGESLSTSHQVSTDNGATWTTVVNPSAPASSRTMRGLARLNNGRWIAYFSRSSDQNAYYSDAEVPLQTNDWVRTSFTQANWGLRCMAAAEEGYVLLTNTRVARTSDGESYTVVFSDSGAIPNHGIFVTASGTVITYGNAETGGPIAVSRDRAVTFDVMSLPGMGVCHRIDEVDGRLYFSGSLPSEGGAGLVYVSDDDARTFTPVPVPWAVTFQNGSADLVPYKIGGDE